MCATPVILLKSRVGKFVFHFWLPLLGRLVSEIVTKVNSVYATTLHTTFVTHLYWFMFTSLISSSH